MIITHNLVGRSRSFASRKSLVGLAFAPSLLLGCGTRVADDSSDAALGTAAQALQAPNCGYALSTKVTKVSKKGFRVRLKITNGGRLMSSGFTVLVNAGAAKLVRVGHGTFQQVENGYLLSTVNRSEAPDDCDGDEDEAADPDVLAGRAYRFYLKFEGAYSQVSAHLLTSSGVACDQTAPTVKLSTSGPLFTSNGTLTLSAQATDDVAVSKVVFARDGVELATARSAPYTLGVPLTNAANGRHRYSATAYDLTGNQASETKSVLVAIGNKFFGTATTNAADYASLLPHFDQVTPIRRRLRRAGLRALQRRALAGGARRQRRSIHRPRLRSASQW